LGIVLSVIFTWTIGGLLVGLIWGIICDRNELPLEARDDPP
jgi:hypothetical protein